jgi:hypothetical protein
MGKIRLVSPEELDFQSSRARLEGTAEGEHALATMHTDHIETRTYFPGGPDELAMFEVHKKAPPVDTLPHAHPVDEIMYVLEGELIIGNRRFGPGSAAFVPANTLYSFGYGEDGVRYLNIRPRANHVSISKEEFMQQRVQRKGREGEEGPGEALTG